MEEIDNQIPSHLKNETQKDVVNRNAITNKFIEKVMIIKQNGDNYFKIGKWKNAIEAYNNACSILKSKSSDEDKKNEKKLLLRCLSNLLLCYSKIENVDSAILIAKEILDLDFTNIKALYNIGSLCRLNN